MRFTWGKKTKSSLTKIVPGNDILDKVIDMKHTISEIFDIVVESLVKQNANMKHFKEKESRHVESQQEVNTKRNQNKQGKSSIKFRVNCYSCHETFEKICDIEKHIKTKHTDHKSFNCDKCDKDFVTNWRLKKHMKMHSNPRLKQCFLFPK